MANDDSTKRAALSLLRRGLVTQSEAARLAGISKQLMGYWCAEIDVEAARSAYMSRIWQKATAPKRR